MIYLDAMGHLFSDVSLDELYDFAVVRMGMKPEWNHYSKHFPHFDLINAKTKNKAKSLGAVMIEDRRELVAKIREVEAVFAKLYPLPYYPCKGLVNQPIIRVDFQKYHDLKNAGEFTILFWHAHQAFGELSQWYIRPFKVAGVEYNCAEQYIMAQKAALFGDKYTLSQIMATEDPKQQKALGRKVAGFNDELWDANKVKVAKRANLEKFTQHNDLKTLLLSTGNIPIAEASPLDKIWGIGLKEDDPKALIKGEWQGQNLLGIVLMDLRKYLQNK